MTMHIALRLALGLSALSQLGAAPVELRDTAVSAEHCTSITPTSVYSGLGYNHVVKVVNSCEKTVTCEVWTDVDPDPKHTLSVAAGAEGSVVTRRGSPAQSFRAAGKCHF